MSLSTFVAAFVIVFLMLLGFLALGVAIGLGWRPWRRPQRTAFRDESTYASPAALIALVLLSLAFLAVTKVALGAWLA